MAKLSVTLEHHQNRRYHVISHGPGRRPANVTYGNFDLRFRPQRCADRIRVPLDTKDITEALRLRSKKETELNAAPVVEPKPMLQAAGDTYLKEMQANRKKRTWQNYSTALKYFIESTGNKPLDAITRSDMLNFKTHLRDVQEQGSRSVYNKFEHTMTFLKTHGITSATLLRRAE